MKKILTSVYLTERNRAALKKAADERGISAAQVLREIIDGHFTKLKAV